MVQALPKGEADAAERELRRSTRKRNFDIRVRQNNPAGKSPKVRPDPAAKIFRLTRRANQCFGFARLTR
jgi:hypothetical protein